MKRQLARLAMTGLFALALLFASETKGMAQWFGYYGSYSPYYSGYYSSYYSPYYSYYSPYSYSGYYGYSSYYAPSYGSYWAGYYPGGYGCSSCGYGSCGCSSCGCGDLCCSSCGGCSSCGTGCCGTSCCGVGGCGSGCAADAATNGPQKPIPDSKGSGSGPYDDKDWQRSPGGGGGAGTPPSADETFGRKSQEAKKVPPQTVPQKENAAPDASQETPPAGAPKPPAPGTGSNNPSANAERTMQLVHTLRGLDDKMTEQSHPKASRISVKSNLGRIAIARRVVQPARDWEANEAPRLVQK